MNPKNGRAPPQGFSCQTPNATHTQSRFVKEEHPMPRGRKKKDKQKPHQIDPQEALEALRKFVEVDDEPPLPEPQEGKGSEHTAEPSAQGGKAKEEPSPENVSTEEADRYILSFFKKEESL
jgi:hypothetical protein